MTAGGAGGEVVVVLAATDAGWAADAAAWMTAHAHRLRLRGDYVMGRDAALAESYDCLVVDADSTLLDSAVVDQLHGRGTAVVGVADPQLSHTRTRLEAAGPPLPVGG